MRGGIDWKLIRPFWGDALNLRLKHFQPICAQYAYYIAKRVYGRHMLDTPARLRHTFLQIYAILYASCHRADYIIKVDKKLGWSLRNCVPSNGVWKGVNLTEAGKFCGKSVCPWCWYRKLDKLKARIQIAFPKQYSVFTMVRAGKEAIYDKLQCLGFNVACRQEILKLKSDYVKVLNYRLGEKPGLTCTVFTAPRTVWQDKELPVKMTSFRNIDTDLLAALEFPIELLSKSNYDETIKYIKAMHAVKQFSSNQREK